MVRPWFFHHGLEMLARVIIRWLSDGVPAQNSSVPTIFCKIIAGLVLIARQPMHLPIHRRQAGVRG